MAHRPIQFSNSGPVPSTRTFFIHVTDGPLDKECHYARVNARLAAEGPETVVYLDQQIPLEGRIESVARDVVSILETDVYDRMTELLGPRCDVDGDGKFVVLISPWLSRLQGGRTSIDGFVRRSDFQPGLEAPFSHQCDMLCLNSRVRSAERLRTILTHEYAHAVCFSRCAEGCREDWLNEAVAHVAECRLQCDWSNLDHRIYAFLAAPQSSPLVVPDYYHSGLWRDPGCRGATFLFLQWCTERLGDGGLKSLIQLSVDGRRALEEAAGVDFPMLFRQWTMALLTASDGDVDAFGRVPIQGSLGDRELNGPNVVRWDGAAPLPLQIRGTAAAYVRIAARPRTTHLRISAPIDAALQVTIRQANRPQ